MTLDGKIATRSGHSRWVTGRRRAQRVHDLRRAADAVLVGVGTVLADDPQLTVRLEGETTAAANRGAWSADSHCRLPLEPRLLTDAYAERTMVATTAAAPAGAVDRVARVARR